VVEFSEIFERVSAILVLRILVGSFLLFILSIFASHKIAGPLHRIENALMAVEKGDLNIDLNQLRAGDEMAELAQTINSAIKKIRESINKCRKKAKKISELSAQLSAQGGGKEQTAKTVEELQHVAAQLVTEINTFNASKEKQEKA
jgi:methyl-accepting chemotaxis protein